MTSRTTPPSILTRASWLGRALTALVLLLACSCGLFRREPPIEKERRELQEAGESAEALIYRALKISVRSVPSALNPAGPDENATKINALTQHLLAQLDRASPPAEGEAGEDVPEYEALSPREYLEVAKEIYELRKVLRETDEDRYPTVLHTFVAGDEALRAQTSWYLSAHEHMLLALTWLGVQQAPRAFRVYETGMIEPAKIEQAGLRLGAHLIRGATFLSEGWPWLCEEEMSGYLSVLGAEQDELLGWARMARSVDAGVAEDEVLLAGIHAPGVLVRGVCRIVTEEDDKQDEALEDLEAFLADAETLGLEGEAVWLVGAYVGLERENEQMALDNLRKLEHSELLGSSERELVSDTIEAVEDREPGRALNKVTDKLLIAKIVSAYVRREIAKVDWRKQVEATSAGRKLLRLSDLLAREVATIKGALKPEQLDDLRDSASQWAGKVGCGADAE